MTEATIGQNEDASISEIKSGIPGVTQVDIENAKNYVETSISNNLVSLNGFEIENLYPKAYEAMRELVGKKSGQSEGVLIDHETAIGILLYTPRSILYELFDINNIFVSIIKIFSGFMFEIKDKENFEKSSTVYVTRSFCESEAFNKAFKILQNNLISK